MASQKKYILSGVPETRVINGEKKELRRVIALWNFEVFAARGYARTIKQGTVGGLVEGEHNLDQNGLAWIDNEAVVADDARVSGDAVVYDNAVVCDNAVVRETAWVGNNAVVAGNAVVEGGAMLHKHCVVNGNAYVGGVFAKVRGAFVGQNARVDGKSVVLCEGSAAIGDAVLTDSACLTEGAVVTGGVIRTADDYRVIKVDDFHSREYTYNVLTDELVNPIEYNGGISRAYTFEEAMAFVEKNLTSKKPEGWIYDDPTHPAFEKRMKNHLFQWEAAKRYLLWLHQQYRPLRLDYYANL